MESDNLKYFELNNSVLKDFDKLMSMHLDYVEDLKVSEIDAKSKLLNIISLCINTKKLLIEADQRINTNSIISNLCKPENLECLDINNVKLPNGYTLKKLTGLKYIKLKNVRFTNISTFFKEIEKPENIISIEIENSDFENNSTKLFERFKNLKELVLKDVTNCKLTDMQIFTVDRNMQKLELNNMKISMEEISNLVKGKFEKNINLEIISDKEFAIKDRLIINNEEKNLIINSDNLDLLLQNLNVYKLDKMSLIIGEKINIDEYVRRLKKLKGDISVLIKDVSQLSKEDALILQGRLNVKNIDMLAIDNVNIEATYSVEEYVDIKNEIEAYVSQIDDTLSETEKFLKIYKILSDNISIDDNFEEATLEINNLRNALKDKRCLSNDFAKILKNCLSSMNIESNIIHGIINKKSVEQNWNQVKLDGTWYNVDIASDYLLVRAKNILKRNAKYCLLSDKTFYETHTPISGNRKFAENNFDKKIIKVYFKTGNYSDKFFKSYFKNIASKIKLLSTINKRVALPEGKISSNQDDKNDID